MHRTQIQRTQDQQVEGAFQELKGGFRHCYRRPI
jgi:hypothetical protein